MLIHKFSIRYTGVEILMNIALVLSGGTGTRLGYDIPKQYIEVNNKPIVGYCLDVIQRNELIDKIQIVADKSWRDLIKKYCDENSIYKFCGFSNPGENRQLSILSGLENIKKFSDTEDLVFIHDAARPMLTDEIIYNCINAVSEKNCDGSLPVLPMKDTVYYSSNGNNIEKLLDRKCLFAGQSPEVFKFGKYYEANLKLLPDEILKINGSTEAAILNGMDIAMIVSDENNFKITTKADLIRFEEIKNKLVKK